MNTAGITAPQAEITTLRAFLNQHEGVYRRVIEGNDGRELVRDEILCSDEVRRLFDPEWLDTSILVFTRADGAQSLHQLLEYQPWAHVRDFTKVYTSLSAMLWFEPVGQRD